MNDAVDSELIDSALVFLSSRVPFAYDELRRFYDKHRSIDLLLRALYFCGRTGSGNLELKTDMISDSYRVENEVVFTQKGYREFLKVRGHVNELLEKSGVFIMFVDVSSDIATCVNCLVSLGEIREVTLASIASKKRIFVSVK